MCGKCSARVYHDAVQAKLKKLYYGIHTIVGVVCSQCTGQTPEVIHKPTTQIKLVSRVLLFDLALRSGHAFQKIKDVGEAMRDNWTLFFGRQRKMPKTVCASVSASITTEPKLFQRHSSENLWAVKDVLEHFKEYASVCESKLVDMENEAAGQAAGALKRNEVLMQQRQEQQAARIQHTQHSLQARQNKLTPRQQMLQQMQFLVMSKKKKEPQEEILPADILSAFANNYYTEYCRLSGIGSTLHEDLQLPPTPKDQDPADALVAVLTRPESFAKWEKTYNVAQKDVSRPSKKQKVDNERRANGNDELLRALKRCAASSYEDPPPQTCRPIKECIAMKILRYETLPLPADVGREVQTPSSRETPDEQAAQAVYVQKWRAWVRSGGGACDMPECRRWSPEIGPNPEQVKDLCRGMPLPEESDNEKDLPDDASEGYFCWEKEKARDYVRMGTPLTNPVDPGSHPQRSLLVDHLVLCEEVEDCTESAQRAAYVQIGKYLKGLYAATRHKFITPMVNESKDSKSKMDQRKDRLGSLESQSKACPQSNDHKSLNEQPQTSDPQLEMTPHRLLSSGDSIMVDVVVEH